MFHLQRDKPDLSRIRSRHLLTSKIPVSYRFHPLFCMSIFHSDICPTHSTMMAQVPHTVLVDDGSSGGSMGGRGWAEPTQKSFKLTQIWFLTKQEISIFLFIVENEFRFF